MTNPDTQRLSVRERQVLQLLAADKQNGEIALAMGISLETVKTHVAQLFNKLGVHTRAGAVAKGFRAGILS